MKKVLIASGSGIALLAASLMMAGSARAYDDYNGDGYSDGSYGYSDGDYGNSYSLDSGNDFAANEGGRWYGYKGKRKRKPESHGAPYASGEHYEHHGHGDHLHDHAPYRSHRDYEHFHNRHHSEAVEHDGRSRDHRWDR